ncbi:MAG: class F sortase [Solirubrobacterales bacterium]
MGPARRRRLRGLLDVLHVVAVAGFALVGAVLLGGSLASSPGPGLDATTRAGGQEAGAAVLAEDASAPHGRVVVAGAAASPLPGRPVPDRSRPADPMRLRIADVDISSQIRPVSSDERKIKVPPPDRVGWHERGPRPGEPGRAVLIGHLDSRSGPAVFSRLAALEPGARITVTTEGGDRVRFAVTGSEQVPKTRFPATDVYGPTSKRRIVLITCGGPFTDGSYRDNVIVRAAAL